MSFDSLLTHTVHLERRAETGTSDDYNQPEIAPEIGEPFMAAIQPRTAREMALISQAGAPVSDHTIFMRARLVASGDRIVHDATTCPVPAVSDLASASFELSGVRNAAGIGHHLEVDARLIGTTLAIEGS
jgi:hypothetical protein